MSAEESKHQPVVSLVVKEALNILAKIDELRIVWNTDIHVILANWNIDTCNIG